ncbi:uncharacterized protein LOC143461995 [Clavelina lepadiformis]|uniref:uncharacterized protein LOC143461995 n=1 Tax=Clavelina lepadiformis TaxID=159417 RepID=UPI004042F66E
MSAMKLTIRQVLLSMILTFLLKHNASGLDNGQQCISSECTQNRGYIQYDGPVSGIRWNIRAENHQYTTFVLHLKPTMAEDIQVQWLRIQQNLYTYPRTLFVKNNKERIFVFEETNEVMITLHSFNPFIRFRLDFYAGCNLVEGDVVNIEKQQKIEPPSETNSVQVLSLELESRVQPYDAPTFPDNSINKPQEPECWFVIPTITETTETLLTPEQKQLQLWYAQFGLVYTPPPPTKVHIEVQQTYMSLETTGFKSGNRMEVTDLISKTTVMSADREDTLDAATLDKSSSNIQYKEGHEVSSLIFVDLNCYDDSCEEVTFNFTANALQQSDVECIEKERRCRFDIENMDEDCENYSANQSIFGIITNITTAVDLGTSNCPAFNLILTQELERQFHEPPAKLPEEPKEEVSKPGLDPRSHSTRSYAQKCTSYTDYCTADNCTPYKKYSCMKMCMVLRKMMICEYILKHSIFA